MKVICDNCRAVYKIPDAKLVKPVNKATCRQCGHRMLIPRPRMDADPDERTLVTAVPPTPAPAPDRTDFQDDPLTHPRGENPEKTSPTSNDDVMIRTATPAPKKNARGTPARGRRTGQVTRPPKRPVTTTHDPATDMSMAFIGVLVALCGSLFLAVIPLVQHLLPDILAPISASIGLMVASGGALMALLVMLTGARGRKPAKPLLSFFLAAALAFFIGWIPMVPMGLNVVAMSTPLEVSPPEAPEMPAVDTDEKTETDDKVDPVSPPTPVEKEEPRPTTRPIERPKPVKVVKAPKPIEKVATAPTRPAPSVNENDLPDDILKPDPPPPTPIKVAPEPTTPSLSKQPPVAAIDVMVKSNVSVKKCFFKHKSAKGSLPPRVDVKFTIRPDGTATKVGIKQVAYAASDLDFCLGSAIKSIRFPPSQDGVSLTFPFQFN
jgi:hypothetical protein